MKPLHLMVTAAAALPMASVAGEIGAAASLHSNNNDENIYGVPTGTAGGHKRARQMKHPIGSTGPSGLYNINPTPDPLRSPYHIVSVIFPLVYLHVLFYRPMLRYHHTNKNLMNLPPPPSNSNTRRSLTADRRDHGCTYSNSYTTPQSPKWNAFDEVRPRP